MTIKDVARLAGVSPSTVSRVVNSGDTSAASPETQEKIWSAVHTLGYVRNENARNLKRSSDSPAVLHEIDCIYARPAGATIDVFFTSLMHYAEAEAQKHGYNLRYRYTISDLLSGSARLEGTASSAIVLGRIDGNTLAFLSRTYKNIVYSGLQVTDLNIDQVISSGFDAASDCVKYLASLGHSRICYLGESENEQRYLGYIEAMKGIGISDAADLTVESEFTADGGYTAASRLIDSGTQFTAIICANDVLAAGVMKALRERRKRIPRDISIIGINDMESVRYLDPMLTAMHIHTDELGRHATRLLIDRIEKGHSLSVKMVIPYSLITRESCAKAHVLK